MAIEKAVVRWALVTRKRSQGFNVSVFAIMQRSKRNNWPVGSRIQRRVEALQEARYKARERYKPYEQQRNSNAQVTEAIAESWRRKRRSASQSRLRHDQHRAQKGSQKPPAA